MESKNLIRFTVLLLTCKFSISDRVCKGNKVDSSNIGSFKDCTEINGHLNIGKETFTGGRSIPKMNPSELEVFSTVKEITGSLSVTASHPDFTDLHYFRNLQMIGEMEGLSGVYISGTSLKSLGLRSLKRISGVIFIYENKNLCFAEEINWVKFRWRDYDNLVEINWNIRVEMNRPDDACFDDNMVCHEECSGDGCWGPGVDECLSCNGFSLEGTCVDSCSYPGIYQSGDHTCAKCNEECDGNCTGPGPGNCVKCKRVKYRRDCVASCPSMTYEVNGDCVQCNETCMAGCTGPGDFLGSGGCDTWDKGIVGYNNPNQADAQGCYLKTDEPCEEGYFSELVNVTGATKSLKSFVWSDTCPMDKPETRHGWAEPTCSATDPVEGIGLSATEGGILSCTFLIGIFVAMFGYRCWQRARSRESTILMTMGMVGLEDSDTLKTADVEPNREQLSIFKDDERCSENIQLGCRALGDHHPVCVADEQVDKATGPLVNLEEPFKEEGPCASSPLLQQDKSIVSNDLVVDRPQGNSGRGLESQFTAAELPISHLDETDMWFILRYLDNEYWIRIGRNLQIENERLNEQKTKHGPNNRECAFEMLRIWHQSKPECPLQDLFDVLRKLRMESAIKQIIKDLSERNSGEDPDSQATELPIIQLDKNAMWPISQYLDNENWIRVGLNLTVATERLNELRSKHDMNNRDRAFQMLLKWRQSNPKCTLQDLFNAMRKLGLESPIEQIKQNLKEHLRKK